MPIVLLMLKSEQIINDLQFVQNSNETAHFLFESQMKSLGFKSDL